MCIRDSSDNVLDGWRGADILDGRGGNDTASYEFSDNGVTIDLTLTIQTGGDAQGDRLISIENLEGSEFNDTLIGDLGNNGLIGGDGNDSLFGGDGNDTLNGDAGNDSLRGQAGDDTINGGDGNDFVSGSDGADTISGGAGDDALFGLSLIHI